MMTTLRDPEKLDRLLAAARETVDMMDRTDRQAGFASVTDLIPNHPAEVMRCIMEALKAGIATNDWTCVAEGVIMLQDLERHVRAMTSG
jgi:hypothetical protein